MSHRDFLFILKLETEILSLGNLKSSQDLVKHEVSICLFLCECMCVNVHVICVRVCRCVWVGGGGGGDDAFIISYIKYG